MILNDVTRPCWRARDLHFLVELSGFEPPDPLDANQGVTGSDGCQVVSFEVAR